MKTIIKLTLFFLIMLIFNKSFSMENTYDASKAVETIEYYINAQMLNEAKKVEAEVRKRFYLRKLKKDYGKFGSVVATLYRNNLITNGMFRKMVDTRRAIVHRHGDPRLVRIES